MAQIGYTPILIYSSSTAAAAPTAGNLTNSTLGSELAINITDGKLFYKDNSNAIQVIGWKVVPTTAGGTGLTSYTAGDLMYYASGTTLTKLAIGATGHWLGSSGTAPQWNAPAALTKTDDTNVTLTLGGSASTALLNAASLTLGWTGQLATTRGGTGLSSFTANGIVYASSTSALATGSALTFDGTNFSTTGSATATRFIPTGSTVPTNGMYLPAANTVGIATNSTEDIRFFSTGGISIGDTTDPGAGNLRLGTGNIVQGTAAKGFNFTANTGAAGKTSQLLNWYEEGTWTPLMSANGAGVDNWTSSTATGRYTRCGRIVFIEVIYTYTAKQTTTGFYAYMSGLPFTPAITGGFFYVAVNNTGGADTATYAGRITTDATIGFVKDQNTASPGFMTGADFPAATRTITFQAQYTV